MNSRPTSLIATMKRTFTPSYCSLALAITLGGAQLQAQDALPVQESVFTAATTSESNGNAWAYILWQSNAPSLMETRTYSIWRKPGLPADPGSYTRAAVVGLQTDPLAVSALIDRAELALGEDVEVLESNISNLFEDLVVGSIDLPDKMASVILGAMTDPQYVENLLLAARRHPALNMALGQAVALPVPLTGATSFEIREHDPLRNADLGVVGRVTVDHASPVLLPGPSVLTVAPKNPQDGFNNLNIKLRWDTPDDLRRLLLMTQGYNLYRVEKAFAESNAPDWSVTSPDAATLAGLAATPMSPVGRVNSGPITPNQMLTSGEVATADHSVSFFTDEETRFPGYPSTHTPPQSGDQYYYFVTVRDLLGRDDNSGVSPATLGTFCDVLPPPIPSGLDVTNEYVYNGGAESQTLRLHWDTNDNSGDKKTTGYFVYRWSTSDQVYRDGGDPVVNLVAGPLWPTPGQEIMTWDDPGPYNALTGLTYDNTVWYTVRASDDGTLSPPGALLCMDPPFGNLSGHSPPVPGVLRDRVGPDAPEATILTWCFRPGIEGLGTQIRDQREPDPDYFNIELIASKDAREPRIVAVEFRHLRVDETIVDLGRVNFPRGQDKLSKSYRVLQDGNEKDIGSILARAVSSRGQLSNWVSIRMQTPREGTVAVATWECFGVYERVPYSERESQYGRDCDVHVIPPEFAIPEGEFPGLVVEFYPPETTRQYKLYYRIDNGPLTLAKEGSGDYNPFELLSIALSLLPASAGDICLFLQVFDLNGNPSRMRRLGCLSMQGSEPIPIPMLAPIQSGLDGITPQAILNWFCPPHGIERFRVWIAADPLPISATSSPLLYEDPTTASPNIVPEPGPGGDVVNFQYMSYDTELIGPLFGAGAAFGLDFVVNWGTKLRVKVAAVTPDGEVGPWSNTEDFIWQPEAGFTGPDVPWPARSMPGIGNAAVFHPLLQAVFLGSRNTTGVRIGRMPGQVEIIYDEKNDSRQYWLYRSEDVHTWLFTKTFTNPSMERSVLPCVLYRTQIPDGINYTTVPGDVVQVSPLMEHIIGEPAGFQFNVYDPFIHFETSSLDQRFADIFLLDTQPQVSGARYIYLMVLMNPETMEPFQIIPVGTVNIP